MGALLTSALSFCYQFCIGVAVALTRHRFNWSATTAGTSTYVVAAPKSHADIGCFEGNYQAYIEDLKRRKGPDADQPHRIAYKKLVRA